MIQESTIKNNDEKVVDLNDNFWLIPKQTANSFLLTELCIYLSQILMFFFVSVVTSNLLRDEKLLEDYIGSKIIGNTMYEVGATMLAIAATLGIVSAISKAAPKSSLLERLADEVLAEAPRTAYIFGSSVAGMFFAASIFLNNHPESGATALKFLVVGFLAAIMGFFYGFIFSYAFKHKALIKSATKTSGDVT